jgi:hypothetical protein
VSRLSSEAAAYIRRLEELHDDPEAQKRLMESYHAKERRREHAAAQDSIARGQARRREFFKRAEAHREARRQEHDPHVLSRMYGADRELLYIGISKPFPSRMKHHATNKPWWYDVSDIHLEHFENEATASEAEVEAIRNERPRYNVVHAVPETPRECRPEAELLTCGQAARLLDITISELSTLVTIDLVDFVYEGRTRRIHRDEVARVAVEGLLWAAEALPADFTLNLDDLVIGEESGYLTEV